MKTAYIINSDTMGGGNDELGSKLINGFFRKIWAKENKPDVIIFYNTAVKLLVKASEVLDSLQGLADAGVEMLACGTCIDFFDLKKKIVVGRISDMQEITDVMTNAEKVVTI